MTLNMTWLYDENALNGIEEVIIFGAGSGGKDVLNYISQKNISVAAVCDNDPGKWETSLEGIPVKNPADLNAYTTSTPVIIGSYYHKEIAKQVFGLGFYNLICGVENDSGPYHFEFNKNNYRAVLILPPVVCDNSFVKRAYGWFCQYFNDAESCDMACLAEVKKDYIDLFLDQKIKTYSRINCIREYDVCVYMSSDWGPPICQPFEQYVQNNLEKFADTPLCSDLPRMYVLLNGSEIRCINRKTEDVFTPDTKMNPFMRLSSSEPNETTYFFPFGSLVRDISQGGIDSFGFRINGNMNTLASRENNHKLIAVFGGSSVFSVCCLDHETFTHRLEEKLNDTCSETHNTVFSVLNFGVPGCTVLNEMVYYIFFCQRIKPDIVISHNGHNDLYHGLSSDPHLLKEYDFSYNPAYTEWSKKIHHTTERGIKIDQPLNSPDSIIHCYLNRVDQFKQLVEGKGGLFFWGLQPLVTSKQSMSEHEKKVLDIYTGLLPEIGDNLKKLQFMYRMIDKKAKEEDCVNFDFLFKRFKNDETLFLDHVHTTPSGDDHIADIYFNRIISSMNTEA